MNLYNCISHFLINNYSIISNKRFPITYTSWFKLYFFSDLPNFSEINTLNDDNQIKVYLSSHSPFESEREGVIITRLLGIFLSISELFCLSEVICLHFLWFPLSTLQHTYICYVKLANGFTWDFVARFHEYIDIRNYPDNNQPYVELWVIVGDVCNTLINVRLLSFVQHWPNNYVPTVVLLWLAHLE